MTIHFAAPPNAGFPRIIRRNRVPANDNGAGQASDALLHAALRHFAEHGLAAAQRARKQAEAALQAGDGQSYRWWLEICRALDKRVAHELDARARP